MIEIIDVIVILAAGYMTCYIKNFSKIWRD